MKLASRALFWDIDGTLLVTGRAGMIAWARAFAAETGGRPFPEVRPDGLTDHQIAAWLLGHDPSRGALPGEAHEAVLRLVGRYESELAGALPLRQGRVLDQVEALLAWIRRERPAVLSWLVTGNTQPGGTAKLQHYGLGRWFDTGAGALDGAFSTCVEPRANIVRRALEMAGARLQGLRPAEALVIGDTPHDIEGAHAIGVPVLAVATNTHSLDELAALEPWRALPRLPGPDEFAALIDAGD